jgi:hypothetical protein
MATRFTYTHHPRVLDDAVTPVHTNDHRGLDHPSRLHRFNARLGLVITNAVGTMWAAYLFAVVALLSLPAVLVGVFPSWRSHFPHWTIAASLTALVAWISSYFLQLVLLPIIIVGQNIQAAAADQRAQQTYQDAEAVLTEALQIQEHLHAQDREIERILQLLNERLDQTNAK